MMSDNDRQEALSIAYVQAVAAVAGMTYSTRSKDTGIDLSLHEIERRNGRYTETGWQLDLQAKSTTTVSARGETIGYDLKVRNYDDLIATAAIPRILVVLVLPPNESRWLRQDEKKLELRRCAYWLSLEDKPAVSNKSQVRVAIPRKQVFTPEALKLIMKRVKEGRALK